MRAIILGLLTLATLPLWTRASAAPAVENFVREAVTRSITLSPSGQRVAVVSYLQETHVLSVYELDGSGKSTSLVRSWQPIPDDIHWLDEDRLIFRSQNALSDWRSYAWHLATVKEPSVQVLDALRNKRVHRVQQRSAAQPVVQEVLISTEGRFSDGFPLLAWFNFETKREREADFNVPRNMRELYIGPDLVATHGFSADERDGKVYRRLHWRSPKSGEWKLLHDGLPGEEPYRVLGADRDGTLYVSHTSGPDQVVALSRFDPATESTPTRTWIKTPGFDFQGDLVRDGATSEIVGARVEVEHGVTVWSLPSMASFQQGVDQRLPGRVNRVWCQRCGQPDMVAEIYSYSDREPGEYWVVRAGQRNGKDAWTRIGRSRPYIDATQSASVELQRIPTRDGRELPVWVTRPPNASAPLPAVVLVPHWPWEGRVTWKWASLPQFLASRGYLVIQPEVRGRSGYGAEHVKAGHGQVGLAMQDDLDDALTWARSQGLAGAQACIMGTNYGGTSTIFALQRPASPYACGVARYPRMDFEPLLGKDYWSDFDVAAVPGKQSQFRKILGDVDRNSEIAERLSPVTLAANIQAPLLLFRPTLSVERQRLDQLEARMRAKEVPLEVVSVHRRLTDQEWEIDFLKRLEAFLAKHLAKP